MTYLKAIEAGVDVVDTALAPFALRSSQPAVEPLLVALQGTPWDPKIDLSNLLKLGEYLESIAPKYRDFLDTTKMSVIDTAVLKHQIPGGMISNEPAQAAKCPPQDFGGLCGVAKDSEGSRISSTGDTHLADRRSSAVLNVLFGRYKMLSKETQDYVYGLYGNAEQDGGVLP